jgi:epoxyqueuosine reductase QueG
MNDLIEEIKGICVRNDIPVFGIARASHLEDDIPGYRPSDLLLSPESMVCLGLPIPKGIFKCGQRANANYWRAANIYYRHFDAILMQVARRIEENGETAVPVYGCFPYDVKGQGDFRGYLSLVRMAEAVGIGKTGKNGLLFNARYGPRLILGGLITTASLPEIAWPHKDNAGCPEDCFVCQEQCPVEAIERNGKVDRVACVKHSMKSPLFSYLMSSKKFKVSDAQVVNHVTAVDDHSMYTCIKCVSTCPHV